MALKPGQRKCIETLDRSLVVAAGAGSGKTFTLTKRVVHAIQSGVVDGIERVCAITFTNKAAGELKSRIKAELRACGLADQALKVDEAWISTIHGMCARILRAHAVELDLDPRFQMADPAVAGQLLSRSIDRVLAEAVAGVAPEAGEWAEGASTADEGWQSAVDALFAEYPARSYGARGSSVDAMLRTLMEAAGSNPRGFDAFDYAVPSVNPAALVEAVADAFGALVDAARAQKPSESRLEWAARTEEELGFILGSLQDGHAPDAVQAVRLLDRLPMPKRVGSADYKAQVAEALEVHRMCVMELRLAAAAPHLDTLLALARAALARFAAAKRAAGVLDNNDLLVRAFSAITDHPGLAAEYADKFQLIMVDEFQDTDQMQVDMIKLLAGPGACRLCTVGDAQQSIYRFRGADVSVYRRHLESVRAGNPDDVILLPDNFRSHADVLSLVDRVFERPNMFGGEFMSLAPGRDESRVKRPFAAGVPRVQVQLTSNSFRGASSQDVRAVAAARIADAFADLHERGHSAGEMAILLGGMTYADVYAQALRERGLACVIAGGSVFAGTPEAKVVSDLVAVAANPYQTEALCNVLTGPMFRLSAGDLLQLATSAADEAGAFRRRNLCDGLKSCMRRLRDEGACPEWSPQLVLALRVMGAFLGGAGRSTVARIVMRAVVDSGWLSRMQAHGAEGLAQAGNVYKAVRLVESVESADASGPAHTARLFATLLRESKEAPGALSATGGDFVRIMTVHASKGLEFPIVAVAEFRDASSGASGLLATEVEGTTYLSLDLGNTMGRLQGSAKLRDLPALYASMMEGRADEGDLARAIRDADGALALRAALHEYDRMGDEEEAKRLLYVALTRAKEALVVSLKGKRTKDDPFAVPKSCMGAVVEALAGEGCGFDVGVSHFDYGGSAEALVEHVALEAPEAADAGNEAIEVSEGAAGAGLPEPSAGLGGQSADGAGASPEAPAELFAVPAAGERPFVARVPYAPAHEGVFSYSSIAGAAHEGDTLGVLAQIAFVSADEAADGWGVVREPSYPAADAAALGSDFSLGASQANRAAAVVDEEDGSWAYVGASCADADKATDLGTAFHRLAQYAVCVRGADGQLIRPPADRVSALARAGRLDDVQRERLNQALARWFGSDMAFEMQAYADLRAEVPFFTAMPPAGSGAPAYLEGEIDLLALSDDACRAVVVDYKTGGRADEPAEALRLKHVLQASCYAYAIMKQGVREVEAVFVRVERGRADDPLQPQCVRYRFDVSHLPLLGQAIARTYYEILASGTGAS